MEKRCVWIDIARGIGILLVVLGHVLCSAIRNDYVIAMNAYKIIYFFHMPFMFCLSGVAFNLASEHNKCSTYFRYGQKKFEKLLVPYFSYSFIIYFFFNLANNIVDLDKFGYGRVQFANWFKALMWGDNQYCVHVWYIYSLFFLSILGFILVKIFGDNYRYVLLIITIPLWFFFYSGLYPKVIQMTAGESIWFAMGTFFNNEIVFRKKEKISIFILTFLLIILKFATAAIDISYTCSRFIKSFIVFFIILSLVAVAQILEKKKYSYSFAKLGMKSFPIYLFHQPFLASGIGTILYGKMHINVLVCVVIAFICCLIIPLGIERILQMKKMRFLKKILLG